MNRLQKTISNLKYSETDRSTKKSFFMNKPVKQNEFKFGCLGSKCKMTELSRDHGKKIKVKKNFDDYLTSEQSLDKSEDNALTKMSDYSNSRLYTEHNEKSYQTPLVGLPQKYIRVVHEKNKTGTNIFKNYEKDKQFQFENSMSIEHKIGKALAEKNKYRIRDMSKNKNQEISCSSVRARKLYQSEINRFKNNFVRLATESIYTQNEDLFGKKNKVDSSKNLRQDQLDSGITQNYSSRVVNDKIKRIDKRPNVNSVRNPIKKQIDSSNYTSIKNLIVNYDHIKENFQEIIKGKVNTNPYIAQDHEKYDKENLRFHEHLKNQRINPLIRKDVLNTGVPKNLLSKTQANFRTHPFNQKSPLDEIANSNLLISPLRIKTDIDRYN